MIGKCDEILNGILTNEHGTVPALYIESNEKLAALAVEH
jgi:hypothetical protein